MNGYWGLLLEMERFRSLKLWTVDGISGVGKLSRSFIFLKPLIFWGIVQRRLYTIVYRLKVPHL